MHEVGIMETALNLAVESARKAGATTITRFQMRIGDQSGVVADSLAFAFDVLARGTMAESARFEIERVPVVCECPACNLPFQPESVIYECPHCHRLSADVRQGKEIELAALEVS
jgi:hydrogenase nickel incorporation protein HypA/HybF